MAVVTGLSTSPRRADLHLGPAERELYAGILASTGTVVAAFAGTQHDPIEVFRLAYALLDGLPPHVVIGMAAEAIRAQYGHAPEPEDHDAP